jgi:hypothetical protein
LALVHENVPNLIGQAAQLVDQRQFGAALGPISQISQLSQLPFATKIVTFLDPNRAGIYDNRIANFLTSVRNSDQEKIEIPILIWLHHEMLERAFAGRVGPAATHNYQLRYQAWCKFLTDTAAELNGHGGHWACGSDLGQVWRAVDVERALFALAAAD